jgi:hypothetical protein
MSEQYDDIKQELIEMGEEDQKMQERALERGEDLDVDLMETHTKRLREIINKIGWPTIDQVGEEASDAAFLIVQHSDHNPSFQEEVLSKMGEAPDHSIPGHHIAYLTDRVRVAEGKDQLYGTQFQEDEQGRLAPYPIEDEDQLDGRREEMGLQPFDDYLDQMKEVVDGEVVWE